jgi:hypothetical protein
VPASNQRSFSWRRFTAFERFFVTLFSLYGREAMRKLSASSLPPWLIVT